MKDGEPDSEIEDAEELSDPTSLLKEHIKSLLLEEAKEYMGEEFVEGEGEEIMEIFFQRFENELSETFGSFLFQPDDILGQIREEAEKPTTSNIDGETVEPVSLVDLSHFTPSFLQEYKEKLRALMLQPFKLMMEQLQKVADSNPMATALRQIYLGDGLPNLKPITNILAAPNFLESLLDMSELGKLAAGLLQRLMNIFDINTCAGQKPGFDDLDLSKVPIKDLLTDTLMDKIELLREGLERIVVPNHRQTAFAELRNTGPPRNQLPIGESEIWTIDTTAQVGDYATAVCADGKEALYKKSSVVWYTVIYNNDNTASGKRIGTKSQKSNSTKTALERASLCAKGKKVTAVLHR